MKSKILLGPIFMLASIWGTLVLEGPWPWAMLKAIYGSIFWAYPLLLIIDIAWSFIGKNPTALNEFYNDFQVDLGIVLSGYLILMLIYAMDGLEYGGNAIDFAALAIPFWVATLRRLCLTLKMTINGQKVNNKILYKAIFVVFVFSAISTIVLVDVASGTLSTMHSIWIQITVVCISLYFHVESAKIHFFLKSGKASHSSIHRYIFSDSKTQLYESTRNELIKHNNKDKSIE